MTSIGNDEVKHKMSHKKVSRIYQTIKGGNVSKTDFENFLQSEGDINYRIQKGSSEIPHLLEAALKTKESDHFVFGLLLDYGIHFTFKNEQSQTIVHKIIEIKSLHRGHLPMDRTFSDDDINAILSAHLKFNNTLNPCDTNGISHFHAACITNNSAAVEFFLNNGVDVNQTVNANSKNFPLDSPLHLAVKYTGPNVLEILLNHGAEVHVKNTEGFSPLHLIVERAIEKCKRRETPRFVRTLNSFIHFVIDNEIDTDEFGFCKLHLACLLQDESLVEQALEQVTDINKPVSVDSPVCPGFIALHFATFSNIRIFKLLLENGAQIDAKNTKGQTAFDLCLQNFTIDDIHSIITSKSEWKDIVLSDNQIKLSDVVMAMENIDEFNSFLNYIECSMTKFVPFDSLLWPGHTILHLAVIFAKKDSDSCEIVVECLKRGADITKADAKGSTPLHLAFYMQKQSTIDCMLNHHESSINPIDKDNLSHFHIACAANHVKSVKHFLSKGVNINDSVSSTFIYFTHVDYNILCYGTKHYTICPGSTAFHINIASGHTLITEILLKYNPDVYAQDSNGFTPVHRLLKWAYCKPWVGLGNSILQLGRLKNITAKCGLSHLHIACYFRNQEVVKKLLEIGADPQAVLGSTSDIKDYDDVNYGSNGNYGARYSYLSEFDGYTALDFLWHSHKLYYQFDCKQFIVTGFMLIQRYADMFADRDKALPLLEKILCKIDSFHCIHTLNVKWQENVATPALKKEFGVTTLHLGCILVDVKLVEDSINRGMNVNSKVNSKSPVWKGYTPLHLIVKRPFYTEINKNFMDRITKIIQLLMKHGADPMLVDDDDNTPLHEIGKLRVNHIISQFEPSHLYRDVGVHPWEFLDIYSLIALVVENMRNFKANHVNDQNLSVFHVACITLKKDAVEEFLINGVDVNLTISDFSDFYPECTVLHILIDYFKLSLKGQTSVLISSYGSNDEIFLQIVDLLIRNGANVNAIDPSGETPLHKAAKLKISRRMLIKKLICNGADVHVMNMHGNTAFELLLKQGDISSEEIERFLNAGCHWDSYNSITREGYMAEIFRFQLRDTCESENIMDNPIFFNILKNSKIAEVNSDGRTAMHNVVSLNYFKIEADESRVKEYRSQILFFWRTSEEKDRRRYDYEPITYKDYYKDLIEQLSKRGCDIDHEDNEGQTALHLAVIFKNDRAIIPILKMGADINIVDKNGKTAFAYCRKFSGERRISWNEGIPAEDYYYSNPHMNKAFARHIHKLEFCGLHVSDENKLLQVEMLKTLGPIRGTAWDCFQSEIEMSKNIKIGKMTLSLYEFLMNKDTEMIYMDMTVEERSEFDQFFDKIGEYKFSEIDCLLRFKYRQTIERLKLVEPAKASLNQLFGCEWPDVCCRIVFKILKNEDLKRLLASTTMLDL